MTRPHPVRCDKSPLGTSTLRVGALAIQRLAGDLSGARLESRGLPHWLSISPLLASRWRSLIRSKRSCNNFTIPPVPPVVVSYRQTNRPKIATTTTAMKRSMIMCNPRYRHIMMARARLHRNRYFEAPNNLMKPQGCPTNTGGERLGDRQQFAHPE